MSLGSLGTCASGVGLSMSSTCCCCEGGGKGTSSSVSAVEVVDLLSSLSKSVPGGVGGKSTGTDAACALG